MKSRIENFDQNACKYFTVAICALIGSVIITHIVLWQDWVLFSYSILAMLVFGAFAVLPSAFFIENRHNWLFCRLASDTTTFIEIIEVSICAALAVPLCYIYRMESIALWIWVLIMFSVCIGLPLGVTILLLRFVVKLVKADIDDENVEIQKAKERWAKYVLGDEGVLKFKSDVERFRQDINLKFSLKRCMRPILKYDSMFDVDFLIGNCIRELVDIGDPCPSSVTFYTTMNVKGVDAQLKIVLWQTGEAAFSCQGLSKHDDEEFETWQDMIDAIDSRL